VRIGGGLCTDLPTAGGTGLHRRGTRRHRTAAAPARPVDRRRRTVRPAAAEPGPAAAAAVHRPGTAGAAPCGRSTTRWPQRCTPAPTTRW